MTTTFTPAESARLADMDAAPDAPESYAATVERMARAIAEARGHRWGRLVPGLADEYRREAEAAYRAEHERGDGAA